MEFKDRESSLPCKIGLACESLPADQCSLSSSRQATANDALRWGKYDLKRYFYDKNYPPRPAQAEIHAALQ